MKKAIVLNVTAEDIAKAERDQDWPRSRTCPLAQALNRQEGGQWNVGFATAFRGEGVRWCYRHNAGNFITAFDDHLPVKPRQVQLQLV